MDYRNHIVSDHRVMLGKPVIKGTRITVELVLKKMAEGATASDIIGMYDQLTEADIAAVLTYASEVISSERLIPEA
jgi:uncharacterized protein (DUF433 family)